MSNHSFPIHLELFLYLFTHSSFPFASHKAPLLAMEVEETTTQLEHTLTN